MRHKERERERKLEREREREHQQLFPFERCSRSRSRKDALAHDKEKERKIEKEREIQNGIEFSLPDSRSSESSPRTWLILACRRGTRRFRHHHRPRVKTTCLRYCAFTTARVYYTTAQCVYVLRHARERERDS